MKRQRPRSRPKREEKRCTKLKDKKEQLFALKQKLDKALENLEAARASGNKEKIWTATTRARHIEDEMMGWQQI